MTYSSRCIVKNSRETVIYNKSMKKIMFNDKYCLTKAVLEGWKTQTRRIIHGLPSDVEGLEIITLMKSHREYDEQKWVLSCHTTCRLGKVLNIPYQVGEEVAIAQSYHALNKLGYLAPEWLDHYCEGSAGYDNKMFVRPGLMPHRIKMTNLRIERLQDICVEDCLKEGIKLHKGRFLVENDRGVAFYTNSPLLAYRCLINGTCGKGTWESNPYVFVYDFELIQ